MELTIGQVVVGILFFVDWLFKSFVTGMFFGNLIGKKILNRVNRELDNCTFFGENNGKNR